MQIQTIVLGGNHSCAISPEKKVWCWGQNRYGELSLDHEDTGEIVPAPTQATRLQEAKTFVLGPNHGCGVWPDSSVKCWGFNGLHWQNNGGGQLGKDPVSCAHPTCPPGGHPEPATIQGLVASFAAVGHWHSCSRVPASAELHCWGSNKSGELGTGAEDNNPHPQPVLVGKIPQVDGLALGDVFSCALTTQKEVWCWGFNNEGMLGTGNLNTVLTPTKTSFQPPVSSLRAGWKNVCALKGDDGSLWCAGKNTEGQLGLGSVNPPRAAAPVPVKELPPVSLFDIGSKFACALSTQGTVWCWGENTDGQVSPKGVAIQPSPVEVPLPLQATRLATGYHHACALLSDGSVWCWGRNTEGQLGLGDTLLHDAPRQVVFPP